jgi:hypothetical protein
MYVKRKITSRRLLPEGEQPLPRSITISWQIGQNNKNNSYCCQLPIVFLHQSRINANLSRCKRRSGDKIESGIAEAMVKWHAKWIKTGNLPNQFSSKPQEGLLEVVVGLGRDLKILNALLPVEGHGGGLDLPLL